MIPSQVNVQLSSDLNSVITFHAIRNNNNIFDTLTYSAAPPVTPPPHRGLEIYNLFFKASGIILSNFGKIRFFPLKNSKYFSENWTILHTLKIVWKFPLWGGGESGSGKFPNIF